MTTDATQQLALALGATEAVLDGIAAEQWMLPSPCTEWSVRDLADHLVTGNDRFTAALGGPSAATPVAGSEVPEAYRRSARRLLDAFGQPGVLDKLVDVPFGTVPGGVALQLRITEVLVHGWDLAQATGQPPRFPEDLAEQALTFSQAMLSKVPAGRQPFAPPQPVADDAPAIDRLAACLGRRVRAGG